uniref:Secreted protein n=1 Tax=Lotharella oceanica TaxID=641309 RepID=A0A7S2X8Q6_9EUKA
MNLANFFALMFHILHALANGFTQAIIRLDSYHTEYVLPRYLCRCRNLGLLLLVCCLGNKTLRQQTQTEKERKICCDKEEARATLQQDAFARVVRCLHRSPLSFPWLPCALLPLMVTSPLRNPEEHSNCHLRRTRATSNRHPLPVSNLTLHAAIMMYAAQ